MASPHESLSVTASAAFTEEQCTPSGSGVQLPVSAAVMAAHVQDHLTRTGEWRSLGAAATLMVPNVFTNVRAAFVPEPAGPKMRNRIEHGFSGHDKLVRWVWAHTVDVPVAKWLVVNLSLTEPHPHARFEITSVTPQTHGFPLPTRPDEVGAACFAGFTSVLVPVRVAAFAAPGRNTVQLWTKDDAAHFTKMCKEDKSVEWARVRTGAESQIDAAREAFLAYAAESEAAAAGDKK